MAAATTLVPLKEYLSTSYCPDRHFVDGVLEKRHLGEFDHSHAHAGLGAWLHGCEAAANTITLMGQRIRVADQRVRVADLCVIRKSAPRERVIVTPPLLCAEILSRKDRMSRVARVFDDYLRMGVEHLWLFDPRDRVGYVYRGDGVFKLSEERLEIAGTAIHVDLPELFARLD